MNAREESRYSQWMASLNEIAAQHRQRFIRNKFTYRAFRQHVTPARYYASTGRMRQLPQPQPGT